MDQQRLNLLFEKYQQRTLSAKEQEELNEWFHSLNLGNTKFETWITQAGGEENYIESRLNDFKTRITPTQKSIIIYSLWSRIAVAASILLATSVGGYFLLKKQAPQRQQTAQNQTQDIAPGHSGATLTLANGQKIVLTKELTGKLAQQGNTQIQVNDASELAYTSTGTNTNGTVQYNTLSTTKGEVSPYPLVLADGTKVWLNAESSLTYPTAFTEGERKVTITGEAYFEVAHNAAKPFIVKKGDVSVQVLGTHFNVNAYDDENELKVTLLEGSVKVSKIQSSDFRIIKPGEQAQVSSTIKVVNDADLEAIMAWKNGYFSFHDADIQTVMKQLSRWYNIEVRFENGTNENGINSEHFTGEIGRNLTFKEVLEGIKLAKVNYSIEGGNKVIIKP